jgi:ankyrin repeat protein
MVAKNSNINLSAQNSSPLLLAAMYGYKDIVEYLL